MKEKGFEKQNGVTQVQQQADNRKIRQILSHQNQINVTGSNIQTYAQEFLEPRDHKQLHIFISNCKINIFQPANKIFKNLRTLSLDNNNLESIQSLTKIYMPCVKKILLFNNRIISLKPLVHLIRLQQLIELSLSISYFYLCMNPIKDSYQHLSLCNLSSLKQLRLYQIGSKSRSSGGSINMCAKFNCFFIHQLGVDELFQHQNIKSKLITHLFRCAK